MSRAASKSKWRATRATRHTRTAGVVICSGFTRDLPRNARVCIMRSKRRLRREAVV